MDVFMNSGIKMDILFTGLLLIPIVITAVPFIQNKLISHVQNLPSSIYPLPISVYLIYEISAENNIFGMFGLFVGYSLFFFIYAVSVSLLAFTVKNKKHD